MRISHLPLLLMLTCTFIPKSSPHPQDESCLTHFFQSLTDPNNNLTRPVFTNPCSDSTSNTAGITCNNGRVYKLSLQNLNLKGTISPFISNCTNLQSLDLSNNTLFGKIPDELQYLVNLAVLNLSSNQLSDTIPPSLSMCSYLNIIDLHFNSLSGPIPPQLGGLVRLTIFDVSDNKLSGPVPESLGNRTGNLRRFNVSSFDGNKGLYGYPLGPMKSKGLSVLAIVAIGLGSGLLSLVLSFTVVCVWLRSVEKKRGVEEEGKVQNMMPDY
ncbi:putative non-specific serine/threonine protein kinase [Helianthus annuus]|nr:putative non-specific serine/threonine protein kinase [Helianthus annuus]KAJ0515896.1 putative non-specific serine/threonine protein kinase [Helianthus annuus]KAJ0687870.1 putative non-specific serine/threonine protein kinase [Helianthus annuus]KAJ0873467.1 putative non-specific serine/threonine protein kinase [Helianthus annuus]